MQPKLVAEVPGGRGARRNGEVVLSMAELIQGRAGFLDANHVDFLGVELAWSMAILPVLRRPSAAFCRSSAGFPVRMLAVAARKARPAR